MGRPQGERWRWGLALLVSAVVFGAVLLLSPASGPSALLRAIGVGDDPLGGPADVPPGGEYAFLHHQPGRPDVPVAWDPCREVRYEVNPDGGPDDAVRLVQEAVDEVAAVTGLRFRYEGITDRRPEWERAFVPVAGHQPVLVAWATEDEVEQLEGSVAGVGGSVAVEARSGGWLRYVTGAVTLDSESFADLDRQLDGRDHQRAIVLHELGHVVGLDHVDSPAELMFADNVGRTAFGRGDLNGLARLGRGRCA